MKKFYTNDKCVSASLVSKLENQSLKPGHLAKMLLKLSFLLLIVQISGVVSAQINPVKITGKVSDIKGKPLPGVTVSILQGGVNVITSADGNFAISVPSRSSVLSFSYVGFKKQDIPIGDRVDLNVVLEESSENLNELVVIGYGTVAKKDLTGAISSVSGSQIDNRHTTRTSQALQGAAPGVQVTRTSTDPGAGATIRIRGITTLGSGNDPLVIIDGVPGSLDNVNPEDIDNMSILKDAASSAIYGSRAAAGVILVTTKRAKVGQAAITYNVDYGIQASLTVPEFVDGATYMSINNQAKINDGASPIYKQSDIDNWTALHASDPDKYPDENWNDIYFKKTAALQRHNLDFAVGSEKIKSKISMGYDFQDGLDRNRDFRRLTLRANNDFKISNIISASADLAYVRNINRSPTLDTRGSARYHPPIFDSYYDDGRFAPGRDGGNPIAQNELGGRTTANEDQFNARLRLDVSPVEGLKLSAIVAPQLYYRKQKAVSKIVTFYDKADPSLVIRSVGTTNSVSETNENRLIINSQFLANYNKNLGQKNNFTALLGYENNSFRTENSSLFRDGFILPGYDVIDLGSLTNVRNGGNASENALRSFFGRLDYSYGGKYLFGVSSRYDGSSRFAPENRWGFFPAIQAGWVVTEENFGKKLPFNQLKVRGSWGRNGNQEIGNYAYLSTIDLGTTLFYNNSNVITAAPTGNQAVLNVRDKSWETKEDYNIGLDLVALKNKLSVSADYASKNTYDILLQLGIPGTIGLSSPTTNEASVTNKGWEFIANWNDKVGKDWSYSVSINVSDFKNKVIDTKGVNTLANNSRIEGQPLNVFYGFRSAGYFQNTADVAASAKLQGNEKPGDLKFVDINGDGKIDAANDRVVLGDSNPRYLYGGNASVDYKNFTFSFSFQGVGKQVRNPDYGMINPVGSSGSFNAQQYIAGNTWAPDNPNAKFPRVTVTNATLNYGTLTNFYLFNGSYFRLKDVNLSYRFKPILLKHIGAKSARVYLAGTDVFSIANKGFQPGWDPESSGGSTPLVSTFFAGLSITF